MRRKDAVKIIYEIFNTDTYGFRDSMTDEQIKAIRMALSALEFPGRMNCGGCLRFADEDAAGLGRCEQHDRYVWSSNYPCGFYEQRGCVNIEK